jgi:hypothetical protein
MANDRIEYRFVIDSFSPETIPQARLAGYLADLAALYGDEDVVHFVGVETSSLAVVSGIDADADASVAERLEVADSDHAAPDIKRAFQSLSRRIAEDRGRRAYIARGDARVLDFAISGQQDDALAFGPFWQPGHLSGVVILLGGKTDRVSVKIQAPDGETYTCKADREVAKRLRDQLFEGPVRLTGTGRWTREVSGRWRLEQFNISGFSLLDDDSLTDTIATLRTIDGKWKDRPDPLAEIDELRRG